MIAEVLRCGEIGYSVEKHMHRNDKGWLEKRDRNEKMCVIILTVVFILLLLLLLLLKICMHRNIFFLAYNNLD